MSSWQNTSEDRKQYVRHSLVHRSDIMTRVPLFQSNAVRVVCHDNMAQEVQLQNLYRRFPQLDEVVIHKVLVKNR